MQQVNEIGSAEGLKIQNEVMMLQNSNA